ncbi:MAG: hypothetical protein EP335_18380 [Alphaproteobacteria bacterium]|nr:MAG: hypothetical protein EP335_18380 [Alphaproteobacteria bacterium]
MAYHDYDDDYGAPSGGPERHAVLLVYILYVIGILTGGAASIIGVIIAHLKEGGSAGIWRGHYIYQIRTFWLGVLMAVVAIVAFITFIGIPVAWAIGLWWVLWNAVRTLKGLLRALDGRPIEDPRTNMW